MSGRSRFHFHFDWAKARLDEMDAALASLERQVREAKTVSREKAEPLIAVLRRRRQAFEQAVNTWGQAEDAAWQHGGAELERQWDGFMAEVDRTVDAIGLQAAAHQEMFRDLAAAQQKAWHHAREKLRRAAAVFVDDRRTEIEHAALQMEGESSKAQARLKNLMTAASESRGALNAALGESRASFDRAIRAAEDAFGRAARPGTSSKPDSRAEVSRSSTS